MKVCSKSCPQVGNSSFYLKTELFLNNLEAWNIIYLFMQKLRQQETKTMLSLNLQTPKCMVMGSGRYSKIDILLPF